MVCWVYVGRSKFGNLTSLRWDCSARQASMFLLHDNVMLAVRFNSILLSSYSEASNILVKGGHSPRNGVSVGKVWRT